MASRNTSFEDRPIDVSCLSKDDLILKNLGRSASAQEDLTLKKNNSSMMYLPIKKASHQKLNTNRYETNEALSQGNEFGFKSKIRRQNFSSSGQKLINDTSDSPDNTFKEFAPPEPTSSGVVQSINWQIQDQSSESSQKSCMCNPVLVADDNEFNLFTLQQVLISFHVDADGAANG